MKRIISSVLLSLAVASSGTIASAHDLFPPCWRGQPGATFQEWGFLTDANPAAPDLVANPYGSPSASITPGAFSDGFLPTQPGSTNIGFWDLGRSGTIQLTVPNKPGASGGSYKYVAVQVAQYIGGVFVNYSTVSIPGATYVSGQRQLFEPVPPFGGIYVDQTVWQLAPNPASEVITITSPANGGLIDQIVVDTICVDPVATISPAGTPTVGTQTSCLSMVFAGGGSYTWDLANASGTAGTGWDLLSVTGTNTIDVQASSGSPFTINVNSPPGGPANFNPSQGYNWTIATASGGILNFAAAKFVINSNGFQGNLAGDAFGIKTANSGKDLVLYLNHPPAANNVAYVRPTNTTWKIKISDLMTNAAPQDPGDTLSFVSVAGGTDGAVSTNSYGYVCYAPNLPDQNRTDSFTYTVKDNNNGLQASGTVTLTVAAQQPGSFTSINYSPGQVTLTCAGVPGSAYDIQRATSILFSDATVIWTTNAPPGGVYVYVDNSPTSPAFYRIKPH